MKHLRVLQHKIVCVLYAHHVPLEAQKRVDVNQCMTAFVFLVYRVFGVLISLFHAILLASDLVQNASLLFVRLELMKALFVPQHRIEFALRVPRVQQAPMKQHFVLSIPIVNARPVELLVEMAPMRPNNVLRIRTAYAALAHNVLPDFMKYMDARQY
jgi:hypothetical protein